MTEPVGPTRLTDPAAARLAEHLERRRAADGIPGVSLSMTSASGTIHIATAGYANLDAGTRVTPEHVFQIGSVSKSFTAVAALQLAEEGRIDLHAPVTEYLPWFAVPSRHGPISLHHLLSHTAGLVGGLIGLPDPRAEVYALRDSGTGTPPGTWFNYSNVGYAAIGLAIARVAGRPFRDVLRERVLEPLDMTSSLAQITWRQRPGSAVGYSPLLGDRPYRGGAPLLPAAWLETDSADGSICSTPEDMARYMRMLLNRGRGPHGAILSEATFDAKIAPAIAREREAPDLHYGYGIGIRMLDGRRVLAHSGGMVGFYSYMACDVERGVGVMVMGNGPTGVLAIADYALRLLWADTEGEPLPDVPAVDDPRDPSGAAAYAGTYRGDAGTLTIDRAADGTLQVETAGRRAPLLHHGGRLLVDDPELGVAPLELGRRDGQVVEVFHGSRWFRGDGYDGPTSFDHPARWRSYLGCYTAHSPWNVRLHVILRKGALLIVDAASGYAEPLEPLADGRFRPAEDERLPDRFSFERVIDGNAHVLLVDGQPLYRCSAAPSAWSADAE